jgi:hypothetical protein
MAVAFGCFQLAAYLPHAPEPSVLGLADRPRCDVIGVMRSDPDVVEDLAGRCAGLGPPCETSGDAEVLLSGGVLAAPTAVAVFGAGVFTAQARVLKAVNQMNSLWHAHPIVFADVDADADADGELRTPS